MSTTPSPEQVPSPLGWCSWHLTDDGAPREQAVTLIGGTALCEECNARQLDSLSETAAQVAAAQQQTPSLSRFGGPSGF